METLEIILDEGAYIPERAHDADAGYDLRTPRRVTLWSNSSVTIDTGVHMIIPEGYYGKIESKSGLNVNNNIVSCGGVIDAGYTGSIAVKLYNLFGEMHTFEAGDKIAQIIIQKHERPKLVQVYELPSTERGSNGFGSTGV